MTIKEKIRLTADQFFLYHRKNYIQYTSAHFNPNCYGGDDDETSEILL